MSSRRKIEDKEQQKLDLKKAMGRETRNRIIMVVIAVMMITSVSAAVILTNVPKDNPVAEIITNKGTILVELYQDKAPITVENFIDYANENFYDGTIFHRVMAIPNHSSDFMIQGGGFTENMTQKATRDPIKNEAGNGLSNEIYTIAMARTSVVDSATSQFYINVANNTFLDHKDNTQSGYGYCVFGKVISGFDVVMAIARVQTHTVGAYANVPVDTITIESIQIIS